MTPKAQEFMQEFTARFSVPNDWGEKAQHNNLSTLEMWYAWIDRDRTSMDIVRRVLDQFHSQDKRPRLYDVKRAYGVCAGMSKQSSNQAPQDKCEACGGDGVVLIPCVTVRGANYVITRPGPYRRVWQNSAPCRCSVGARVNARAYRMEPSLLERCFSARRSPGDIHMLQSACAQMANDSGQGIDEPGAAREPAERHEEGDF